ncbi:hypothetical protein BDU57DRAFT_92370 [Ampelomyces quisqualis]|uniref:Fungal N-terminal domain-containing protein n=1 Tax=Ampelomyces quisqualis TaxID=50730 RepID=A0A6A5Q9X5_AMPQU|nr:hypothetical protein BDU57DRAFT_92370 [Ampelomyces quisqualis]
MAEIFGAVAAGISLCTQLTRFGIAIHKAIKEIKNSRRDIAKLANETILFASSSEDFLRFCADDHRAKSSATCSIRPLITWIRKTKTGLFKLLQNVEALRSDPQKRLSLQKILIAYLKWYFSKKEVKCLRVSLDIARASMNGYSNLMCIRKLEEELRLLSRALKNAASRREVEEKFGMSITDKIKLVKEAIKIKNTVHHTNKQMMEDSMEQLELKQQGLRTSEFVSAPPDDLFEFTGSLQRFSQEIMPSISRKPSSIAGYHMSPMSNSSSEQESSKTRPRGRHRPVITISQTVNRSPGRRPRGSASNGASTNSTREGSIPSPIGLLQGLHISSSDGSSNAAKSSPGIDDEERAGNVSEGNRSADRDTTSPRSVGYPIDAAPRKSARVGRYAMILDAHYFRIHDQKLTVTDYATGDAFFNAMLRHEDKVEAVVKALSSRGQVVVFDGIPGWLVDSNGVHAQASGLQNL